MMLAAIGVLMATVELAGVTGENLRARAFFDANNVTVGDPLVLTVDFLGDADFAALHPPKLAREVAGGDWRLDDDSAKTDTFRNARRITYRVRPMREGVLVFPELVFGYLGRDGGKRLIKSNAIPVHARPGSAVAIDTFNAAAVERPVADRLIVDPGTSLTDDERFAWERALSSPSADAFGEFDFPAARLNEASEAIRAGDWSRALAVYSRLEWVTGQTAEIERGIIAALAVRYDDSRVELPVWRSVLRPILRYGWKGRLIALVTIILSIVLLFKLIGRAVRSFASVLFVLILTLPGLSQAQDVFEEMERRFQEMQQQVNAMMSGRTLITSQRQRDLKASVSLSNPVSRVGETVDFTLALEAPRSVTLESMQIAPSVIAEFVSWDSAVQLADIPAVNPSNVIHRYSIPARFSKPYSGSVAFSIGGMRTQVLRNRFGSSRTSYSFAAETGPVNLKIAPLPVEGQPEGFFGIVAEHAKLMELPDILKVSTNDIVTITYRLRYGGYVPEESLPREVAYEWSRNPGCIEWKRYFIAGGEPKTPVFELDYYDPVRREYRKVSCGGTKLKYE